MHRLLKIHNEHYTCYTRKSDLIEYIISTLYVKKALPNISFFPLLCCN